MKFRTLIAGAVALFMLLTSAGCGSEDTDQSAIPAGGDQATTLPEQTTITVAETTTTTEPLVGGVSDTGGIRPPVAKLKTEITSAGIISSGDPDAEKILDCLAQEFYDSDLPNGLLRKIFTGEDIQIDTVNEDKYNQIYQDILAKCGVAGD